MAWQKSVRGYKTFLSEYKAGKIGSIVLMYGPEVYLAEWATSLIVKKYVRKGFEPIDLVTRDWNEVGLNDIVTDCETFSMMSEKRVVCVRNFSLLESSKSLKKVSEGDLKEFLSYVEKPNPKTILILICDTVDRRISAVKTLVKHSTSYEFERLERGDLASFAHKRIRGAGLEISRTAMNYLLDSTGYFNKEGSYDLYRFENDIEKVIAHAEGGLVTEEDVERCVKGDGDSFIFDLLDGISANDKGRAYEILHNRLGQDAREALSIVGMIVSQIEVMYEIKEFTNAPSGRMSARQIHDYTGIHSFRVEKLMRYSERYSRKKLKKMLSDIYKTNIRIVTGELPPLLALELFIASI